jgi:hypothetical protein
LSVHPNCNSDKKSPYLSVINPWGTYVNVNGVSMPVILDSMENLESYYHIQHSDYFKALEEELIFVWNAIVKKINPDQSITSINDIIA